MCVTNLKDTENRKASAIKAQEAALLGSNIALTSFGSCHLWDNA